MIVHFFLGWRCFKAFQPLEELGTWSHWLSIWHCRPFLVHVWLCRFIFTHIYCIAWIIISWRDQLSAILLGMCKHSPILKNPVFVFWKALTTLVYASLDKHKILNMYTLIRFVQTINLPWVCIYIYTSVPHIHIFHVIQQSRQTNIY